MATSSSFKHSTSLEARTRISTRVREKYPGKIPVIMEKYEHSHVRDLNKENPHLLEPDLTLRDLKRILREKINLEAKEAIFVFVKNTLPPNHAVLSAIYKELKDEDGLLYLTYGGEDIIADLLFTTRISLDIVSAMVTELDGSLLLECLPNTWSPYLSQIQMLCAISESHQNVMEQTREVLKVRLTAFCFLVATFSSLQDRHWVFMLREYTNFKVRYHFAKMMFLHEESLNGIILDRSNLWTDTLEQIVDTSPISLYGDLSIRFMEENAVGDGVLREWFYLVCEELFQQERKLFVPSSDDGRRFTPNPNSASYHEEPLRYYRFAGRFIALALKNNVQVGVLLGHVFYLQLAGKRVSLEDIKHTDKRDYDSCSQILNFTREEFDAAAILV